MNHKVAVAGGVIAGFAISAGIFWYASHRAPRVPKWSHDVVALVDAKHQGEANNGYLMLYYACTKPSPTPNGFQKITYGYAEYDVNLESGELRFVKGMRPQASFRCPE